MPDYSKGKIYAIKTYQSEECYIGSTTLSLTARFGEHRRIHRYYNTGNGKDNQRFPTSFYMFKYDDLYIELIEEFPCINKEQLTSREYQIIRSNPHCINKQKGIANDWKDRNPELHKQRQKEYEEKRKSYRTEKILCDCGASVQRKGMSTHIKTHK
jgi:hypothetical protein